jgi:hypothetical protein
MRESVSAARREGLVARRALIAAISGRRACVFDFITLVVSFVNLLAVGIILPLAFNSRYAQLRPADMGCYP